jgi:hypothetical protein
MRERVRNNELMKQRWSTPRRLLRLILQYKLGKYDDLGV